MPCNSDYMNPTAGEKKALSTFEKKLNGVSDAMVVGADAMREIVLNNKKSIFDNLFISSVMLTAANAYILQGDRIVNEIKNSYAYRCGSKECGALDVYARARAEYQEVLEVFVNFAEGKKVSVKSLNNIRKRQEEHRKEDIKRLIKVFADKGDFLTVTKLANADTTLPLEPQIGFNPDDF